MDIIESLLTCSKEDRVQAWKLLNVHPDTLPLFESKVNDLIQIALEKANLVSKDEVKEIVKDELDTSFDNRLITSELEVLPRLRATEKVTGIYQFEDFEEHEPTIPEKIKELTERLEHQFDKSTESIKLELPVIPKTSLELKAVSLVDKLRIKPRSRTGEVFLDNSELTKFLTTELPEELRSNDSNLRRVKKRVIEKAKSLFPDSILINKSKYGRHETRIILKESYPQKGTVQYI